MSSLWSYYGLTKKKQHNNTAPCANVHLVMSMSMFIWMVLSMYGGLKWTYFPCSSNMALVRVLAYLYGVYNACDFSMVCTMNMIYI
jgi:hypothetical protein